MGNDDFEWRSKTSIVAYIDMIFATIVLLVAIGIIILGANDIVNFVSWNVNKDRTLLYAFGILLGIMVCTICLAIWAAATLVKGSKVEATSKLALDKAKTWLNVNIVFLILSVVVFGVAQKFVILVVFLTYRGTFIYIVGKFIKELERVLSQDPFV